MTSSQFILAYYSKNPISERSIELRANAARAYASSLHRNPAVAQEAATGPHTGILAWLPEGDSVGWPQITISDGRAAAWVGIPEHDALSGASVSPLDMARRATEPGFDTDSFGAPYACFYRERDSISFANDSLGLARIYEFDFGEMVVWATRPGLAHVFAASHVEKSELTWSSMATLGWNAGGYTHIGVGQQVAGSRRIAASGQSGINQEDNYASWVHSSLNKGASWADASAGMARTMSLGHYFRDKPIADLSGGKDSRLLAAAALKAGVTDTVRTVRTDHGEVETAERLVEVYPDTITHLVTEVAQSKSDVPEFDMEEHVARTIRGNEGATVASTALRGPAFAGYGPLTRARFNGHGGEALHGGEYCNGAWKDKLVGQGLSGALDRLSAMVGVARGTSLSARENSIVIVRDRLETGLEMGIESAYGLLNYFYSAERMPFWAGSPPNRSMITPYYSSGLLHHIARTYLEETDFPAFYNEILRSLAPTWAEVPFYRPSGGSRRASKYFWQSYNWRKLRTYILERADSAPNFESDEISSLVREVDEGAEAKRIEVSLSRFVWEVSLGTLIEEIDGRVDALVAELHHEGLLS